MPYASPAWHRLYWLSPGASGTDTVSTVTTILRSAYLRRPCPLTITATKDNAANWWRN